MPHTATKAAKHRVRRRIVAWAALGIGVAASGLAALAGVPERPAPPATAPAPEAPGTFKPTTAQWEQLGVEAVAPRTFHAERLADGRIAVNDDRATPVFSPYAGRVTRLLAAPGEVVQRGQPLFAIAAADVVQGQSDLSGAVAALAKARTTATLAQATAGRQRALYEAKAGALKDLQQAEADLSAARNDLQAAELSVAAQRDRLRLLGKSDKDIARFEATRHIDAETVINAPIDGTVMQRKVGLGQYLSAGAADPVFVIGDLGSVWLVANVRETDAPQVRIGQAVAVRTMAYPGRVFTARIAHIGAAVDPTTHRLPVRATIENADGALKPEMFASFAIAVGDARGALAVPRGAVLYDGDRARVMVARADGRIAARPIQPGLAAEGYVEVLSGLDAGERVVVKGALFVDNAARGE